MLENDAEFAPEDEEAVSASGLQSFNQAVLWGTDWTVETVLAQLKRKNIELNPRFQRRDAWSRSVKSRFIESVILGLPIPQIVLAESRDQRGRYIILDGKQRLLALMQFAGYAEGASNGFTLSGLAVRSDLARKRFRHLEREGDLRPDLDAFLTHTIRTTVIRNWPSTEFLHIVFHRLNTGSLKLSPQELRQAIAPGKFTDYADDETINSALVASLLGRSGPDPRMRDVELLVRAIAFKMRLHTYNGRMKEFLDNSCLFFNEKWDRFENSVKAAGINFQEGVVVLEAIFGNDSIARKLHSRIFNRSIFDALIYYAMDPDIRAKMKDAKEAVKVAYQACLRDEEFQVAIESDTAGIPHTADRLRIWGHALSSALSMKFSLPSIVENELGQQRFAV